MTKPDNISMLIWLILVALTLGSWLLLGGPVDGRVSTRTMSVILIILALVKVRLVIRYFMDVRTATIALKLATDAWIMCCGVIMLYLYLNPQPF